MKPIDKWNYRDCFYHFIEQYKEQTGKSYFFFKKRLGLELMKIKRLNLEPKNFVRFINWLKRNNKLSSLNFLASQLNDYYSSREYKGEQEINQEILHWQLMRTRTEIVDTCKKCGGRGYKKNGKKCKCLKKFLKIRDKIKVGQT